MIVKKISYRRIFTLGVLSVMAIPFALFYYQKADSLQMSDRSVSISSAIPGASVRHNYTFTIPSASVLGSIAFEYCTNSPLIEIACVAPVGFDALGASILSQTTNTGFSVDGVNTTANRLVLTRPASAGTVGVSTYAIEPFTNPTTANQTVFVRISSYSSIDGTGAPVDEGSIAFSTAIAGFGVGAYVPPYLAFCVGVTVSINCQSVGTVLVNFGEFSNTTTATATVQFSAATNDFSGYNIFMYGQTLTSGNSVIAQMATKTGSSVGSAQFGTNLRGNSSPSVGANTGGPGTGIVDNNYDTVNQFRFVDGDRVAYSPISSDYTRYTASYIANVPEDQPPGVYATTLTYFAIATF